MNLLGTVIDYANFPVKSNIRKSGIFIEHSIMCRIHEKFPLIDVAGNLTVCDTEQEVDINWLGHLKTISHLSVTCRGYIASCYYKFDKNPEAFLKPETQLEVLSPGRSKFTANVSHPKKACSAGRKI